MQSHASRHVARSYEELHGKSPRRLDHQFDAANERVKTVRPSCAQPTRWKSKRPRDDFADDDAAQGRGELRQKRLTEKAEESAVQMVAGEGLEPPTPGL